MSPRATSSVSVQELLALGEDGEHDDEVIAQCEDALLAIDVLTALNKKRPDAKREQRLIALRNDAVKERVRKPARGVWPRDMADPFPGDLLPEMPGNEITVGHLGGGLLHHGALLARGLMDEAGTASLVHCIDNSLDAVADRRAGTPGPDNEAWFTPFGPRDALLGLGTEWVRMTDSPRGTFEYVERMRRFVRGPITEYLGERPVMDSHKWTLRRSSPDVAGEWHQDGRFLGHDVRVVNVWIALSRCGGGTPSPGLEVVPRRLDILPSGTEDAVFDWTLSHDVVERAADGVILDPIYEPGDALIFDQRTAHRTGARPGLTATRYAIEAWYFAGSTHYDNERAFIF